MARIVSLIVLTALILFLSVTFYRVVAPFLLPLFLAGIVAALCQPLFRFFVRKTRNRVRVSAGLTTAAILLVLLIPAAIGTFIAATQLVSLTGRTVANAEWRAEARTMLDEIVAANAHRLAPFVSESELPNLTDKEQRKKAVAELTDKVAANLNQSLTALAQKTIGSAGAAAGVAVDVLGTAAGLILSTLIFIVALYYFLADGPALLAATESLVPLHADYQRQLLKRFEQVVRAVILSTFLAALAQGFLTAGAMWVAGAWADSYNTSAEKSAPTVAASAEQSATAAQKVSEKREIPVALFKHFFIILMISTLGSLIPLVGTWIIWGPASLWLAAHGAWGPAIFLFIFGAGVVGTMDNVIRTWVLQSDAQLHPLLAFVSVLGGLQVLGLWGVFVGPVVASCLYALVKIFNLEIHELSKEKFSQALLPGETAPAPNEKSNPASPSDESSSTTPLAKQQAASNPQPPEKTSPVALGKSSGTGDKPRT